MSRFISPTLLLQVLLCAIAPASNAGVCDFILESFSEPIVQLSRFERFGVIKDAKLRAELQSMDPVAARAKLFNLQQSQAYSDISWAQVAPVLRSISTNDMRTLARLTTHPIWESLRQDQIPPNGWNIKPLLGLLGRQTGETELRLAGVSLEILTENVRWLHDLGPQIVTEVLSKPAWVGRPEAVQVIEYMLALRKYYPWRGVRIDEIEFLLEKHVILNPAWTQFRYTPRWAGKLLARTPSDHTDVISRRLIDIASVRGTAENQAYAGIIEKYLFKRNLFGRRELRLGDRTLSTLDEISKMEEWAQTPYLARWKKIARRTKPQTVQIRDISNLN